MSSVFSALRRLIPFAKPKVCVVLLTWSVADNQQGLIGYDLQGMPCSSNDCRQPADQV